jgi:hypothetical protein
MRSAAARVSGFIGNTAGCVCRFHHRGWDLVPDRAVWPLPVVQHEDKTPMVAAPHGSRRAGRTRALILLVVVVGCRERDGVPGGPAVAHLPRPKRLPVEVGKGARVGGRITIVPLSCPGAMNADMVRADHRRAARPTG